MRMLRRLSRAHHGAAYLAAAIVVLMALIGVAVSQALPLAERHPDRIAGWLSDRAGRDVRFDAVKTRWTRRGPLLELDNLRIGSAADAVRIGDAELLVSQYAGLLPGRSFTELRVRGLDLTLEREANGRWRVRGLPGQQQSGGDPLVSLQRLGELQVIGAKLHVIAPALGIDTRIPQAHLRLRVEGERVRAGLRAWMRVAGTPLDAVLDFDRKAGDGRAWLSAPRAELAQWAPLLRFAGVQARAGSGRAQAWAQLRAHRVVGVTADLALQRVRLGEAMASAGKPARETALERVRGKLRWSTADDGWRLDAPLLEFGDGAQAPRIQGLRMAGGRRIAFATEQADIGPLVAVAALSDRLRPALRDWLHAAQPAATLRQVQVVGLRAGSLQASGQVAGLSFRPVGKAPGLRGLGGQVHGDRQAVTLRFDPASAVTFDWPRGFGVPHRVRIDGNLTGWREGAGWRTGTSALAVSGRDYSASVRGGLWFQGDGTRPWMDLAADIGTTPVTAAKGFWMREGMSPAAIRWLDAALVAGNVRDGRALISGDLDHWPFRGKQGTFHASARIDNATIKFQPDWPAAERFDADVDFIADGMAVRGHGAQIGGVDIGGFDAGIEHFGQALLTVNAQGAGDASKLLGLLRASPLQKTHGETLANLEASGPARVDYALRQSLHVGGPATDMRGTVALQGARLAEKRWDLAFTDVTGAATYGRGGFRADALSVRHRQRPGTLALRAGDRVRDARQAFEAELEADLSASELLERAPDLGWLRSRIAGTSAWTIAVALPAAASAQAAPSRLRLRSNLVGTALTLPAPLDKPAGQAMPTTVDIDLPMGEGEIAVAFGNRLALRARARGGQTGVRVALGSNRVDAAPPASGLIATGRSDRLDAIEWAAMLRRDAPGRAPASSSPASRSGPLALRSMDVTVAGLKLIGATFPDTRVRVVPAVGGMAVRLDGRALAGALMLPQAEGAPVAGTLERLYWRASKPGSVGTQRSSRTPASAARASASADAINPAKVPPLNLSVGELRFGDARMGSASLRTQPTAAGMRIVQLQTRAPKQNLDVSGDWTAGAAGERTRLDARLQSQDIGTLLTGFGFGKQVAKGSGSARLQGQWPGGPAGFSLANLSGEMTLDVRDGQLVEIEPGAGRVLGLLSIAQLPRRLAFDFRDFFDKGFAFDSVSGNVHFGGGSARSDNLRIDGPAAEIRIRGAANLRVQSYDQTIDVFPKAGNLLTVAGAIAGGPVGAAIGAAANAVLKKPLGQLAAKTYRVTGPWKEPKVETITRGQAAAGASEPPG